MMDICDVNLSNNLKLIQTFNIGGRYSKGLKSCNGKRDRKDRSKETAFCTGIARVTWGFKQFERERTKRRSREELSQLSLSEACFALLIAASPLS